MRPEPGLLLGGRYELRERIAMGGMGEVWSAVDTHLGRPVAAKVLREEFAGEEMFLERLRTEARNSANLAHPNIAMLHDYGEVDGVGYLVMELITGEPLSDVLDRRRILPPEVLLPILVQTARALHAAHTAGVVHRDVKPSNLLVTPDHGVKITDFGISLGANQAPMTAAGMVMGTAQYLPPEQAMGRAATPAGDIYALGIIAYESLAGRRPFTGTTQVDIAFAHVSEPVPPLPDHIDPGLRDLVMSMLAKEPERRPPSAADLAVRLEEIAGGLGIDDGEWNPDRARGGWRPTRATRGRTADGGSAETSSPGSRTSSSATPATAVTAGAGPTDDDDVPDTRRTRRARVHHASAPRRDRGGDVPEWLARLPRPARELLQRGSWPAWAENRWLLAATVVGIVAVLTLLVLTVGSLGTPTSLGSGAAGMHPIGGAAVWENGALLAANASWSTRAEGL